MITQRGQTKTEIYKGFTISWPDPPQWGATWVANVASEHPHLFILMGKLKVMDGGSRDEMIINAKKYVDSLLG
jgi:hypothetical protein